MLTDALIRRLAEITAPDRAFLSVYLEGPRSIGALDQKIERLSRVLRRDSSSGDEREHLERNFDAVKAYLKKRELTEGSLALFSCWLIDFLEAVPLPAPVADLVRIDSSPYIRPLAEFQDEYENVAVVVADNDRARVFLVSSAVAQDEETVKGNVKNHVRKGGWSQQRYERRRDKQLLLYAREIVDRLCDLEKEASFRRIVLVGGKEILRIVADNLPERLAKMATGKVADLGKGDDQVNCDILEAVTEQERRSERDLWERIRGEYVTGGLAAVGLEEVIAAADRGRVETVLVERGFRPEGRRCRACENLSTIVVAACPACGSLSVFPVDVVNEIAEKLRMSSARTDFAQDIPGLREAGGIAALLRY